MTIVSFYIKKFMVKKKRKKISPPKKKRKALHFDLSPDAKKSILGTFLIFLAVFSAISVLGYGGETGKGLSRLLVNVFGYVGSWIIIISFIIQALALILTERPYPYLSTAIGGILFIVSSFSILNLMRKNWGGSLGRLFVSLPQKYFGTAGSWVFFLTLFLISLILLSNSPIFRKIYLYFKKRKERKEIKKLEKKEEEIKLKEGETEIKVKELVPQKELEETGVEGPKEIIKKLGDKFVRHGVQEVSTKYRYKSLPLALLDKEEDQAIAGNIRANAQIIKRTFQNFGIDVEMGEINIGPTVTQYTLKPAEGVKLSKLLTFQRDLALALAAHPIRMEVPIPGRSLVGIEVPNQKRAYVRLANLLGASEFSSMSSLVIPIGKDVMGSSYYADIERMPHLLVAGATGSGKTIFLNSLILSLLWRNPPDILRFVLIDPKRVEFTSYKSLPHLLCLPITQNSKVIPVIKWLIEEMETRFGILHDTGQRDIISYNEMVIKKEEKQKDIQEEIPQKLPYIIVIIDELADIMASRGKEFEAGIVRLAQMSRAVGIHLVLATQRPSVEIITGLIKANITSRVAFQVASQVDSRTILDMAGAEKLLGRGDMLFLSGESGKPKRIQASFISTREIKRVVEYIEKTEKKTSEELEESLGEVLEKSSEEECLEFGSKRGSDDDELYDEAKRVVIRARKASASLLQRRLKVGYARAARILDILEENGIIGPSQGAKPRDVYITEEKEENEKEII